MHFACRSCALAVLTGSPVRVRCWCVQVYGFMFLVFVILLIVTVCVSIVSTYVLLNSEDYRWSHTKDSARTRAIQHWTEVTELVA